MYYSPNIFVLPNGLTVIHTSRVGSPNIAFSLRVIAGSMYEDSNETGVAHFLEHVLFNGTQKYPSEKQLGLLIDEKGGIRNGLTSKETVEYSLKLLKENAEIGFEFLSQIVLYPLLQESDIEREKKIITQEILRIKSDPKLFAPRLLYSLLFPGMRLGGLNTGDIEDISSITKEKITKYLRQKYSAKNMVVSIVGDISVPESENFAEKYFGTMSSGEKVPLIPISAAPAKSCHTEVMPHLKQANLSLGYRGCIAEDANRHGLELISRILTRGKASRLGYRIRGERGLAYTVTSSNSSYRNHGIFSIEIGTSEDQLSECISIIKNEIKKLCTEEVTVDELAKAYASIKAGITFSFEDSLTEASFYSNKWCSGKIRTVEEELAEYKNAAKNPKYILKVAQKFFSTEPSILILSSKSDIL